MASAEPREDYADAVARAVANAANESTIMFMMTRAKSRPGLLTLRRLPSNMVRSSANRATRLAAEQRTNRQGIFSRATPKLLKRTFFFAGTLIAEISSAVSKSG